MFDFLVLAIAEQQRTLPCGTHRRLGNRGDPIHHDGWQ
jgi:hypothetical protein